MSDKVRSRFEAISFSPVQNASSRLTLVLCPAMTIERLTTGDFIGFSCLNTVLLQLAANLFSVRPRERTVGFRHTVENSCLGGPFFGAEAVGPFPDRAEIHDLSHAPPSSIKSAKGTSLVGYSVGQNTDKPTY